MKRALHSGFSLCTRNLRFTPLKSLPNPFPSLSPPPAFARPVFRSFSSDSDSFNEPKLAQNQQQNGSVHHSIEASNQELKVLVDKLSEGDSEVIPDIFEAILRRKLSGIPDDEFMKQLPARPPLDDVGEDGDRDEFDSDSDSNSDEFLTSDDETDD